MGRGGNRLIRSVQPGNEPEAIRFAFGQRLLASTLTGSISKSNSPATDFGRGAEKVRSPSRASRELIDGGPGPSENEKAASRHSATIDGVAPRKYFVSRQLFVSITSRHRDM